VWHFASVPRMWGRFACGLTRDGAGARALAIGFGLSIVAATAAVAGEEQRLDKLADLSLEEMLTVQLDLLAITGIHHTHNQGEIMVGYSFMAMGMDGNRDGTRRQSPDDLFAAGYMISPLTMDMQMHMFHLMYAPLDELTLMLMMPYVEKSMDHLVNPGIPMPFAGQRFTTESKGAGDLMVSGIYQAYQGKTHQLLVEMGMSFPTGSIDEKDRVPMSGGAKVRLPYPMQLGSGTYDLMPMLTYIGQVENWSWGFHWMGILRLGENENDYRLGNSYKSSLWGARLLTRWMSTSLRLEGSWWGNIHGADPDLNPAMVPTADPDLRAGGRLDLLFGVNLFARHGRLAGNRLALEVGVPVYQRLDGPQLETDWMIRASWDWTF